MLIELYKDILSYAGLEADKEGYVHTKYGEITKPLQINGLNVVLPTYEQLKAFDGTTKFLFHPLAENILEKGQPLIIKKLRECINIKLNYTIGIVCQSLINLIVSPEMHKQLNKEQSELMTYINDIDSKTLENFISTMVSRMKKDPERVFSYLYIKKGGSHKGKKYSRLSVIMFPFYEELDSFKMRKKDKEGCKKLFEYIFSDITKEEEYNYGSLSRVAPYLDVLMVGAMRLASELNDVISLFEDYIDDAETLTFDSNWYSYFGDLEELLPEIRKIPAHGIHAVEEPVEAPVQQSVVQPVVQPLQHPQTTQIQQPQSVQTQQPAQPAQTPELVKTKDGLDFKSIIQNNPAVAYVQNPLANIVAHENYMDAVKNQQGQYPQGQVPGQPMAQYPQGQMPMQPNMYPQGQMPMQPMAQYPQGQMPMQPTAQYPQGQMPMQPNMYPQGQVPGQPMAQYPQGQMPMQPNMRPRASFSS